MANINVTVQGGAAISAQVGENTLAAANSATLSQAWAEGTLPGGAGTKSALEWAGEAEGFADDAAASALSISPVASGMIVGDGIVADTAYVADRAIVNGLPFSIFHARIVGGTGAIQVAVLVDNVMQAGPFAVTESGVTEAVDIEVPVGFDVEFSLGSVAGAPAALFIKLGGAAA
jgi:hypothetical protein